MAWREKLWLEMASTRRSVKSENKTRTEGNGEMNVTNKGEVGGVGALGLDELEESVGSLGHPVGGNLRR